MIYEKLSSESVATCDLCGDELEPIEGREAARKAVMEAGWVQQRIDGVLMDVCTECQGERKEPEPFIISREMQKFFGG